jgi:hypothetical protein
MKVIRFFLKVWRCFVKFIFSGEVIHPELVEGPLNFT